MVQEKEEERQPSPEDDSTPVEEEPAAAAPPVPPEPEEDPFEALVMEQIGTTVDEPEEKNTVVESNDQNESQPVELVDNIPESEAVQEPEAPEVRNEEEKKPDDDPFGELVEQNDE